MRSFIRTLVIKYYIWFAFLFVQTVHRETVYIRCLSYICPAMMQLLYIYLPRLKICFYVLFQQLYFMRLLADSTYCDQCLESPSVCREVSGTFAVTVMSKGYNPVVTVPVGACFLNVTERRRSKNYLGKLGKSSIKLNDGQKRLFFKNQRYMAVNMFL